jgi:hypothetical protein
VGRKSCSDNTESPSPQILRSFHSLQDDIFVIAKSFDIVGTTRQSLPISNKKSVRSELVEGLKKRILNLLIISSPLWFDPDKSGFHSGKPEFNNLRNDFFLGSPRTA